MTHDELVLRAVRWLRGTRRCGVVLAELTTVAPMVPDAIGWADAGTWSVLIECKTSRSDFRADAKKPHRRPGVVGVGQERWYMAPPGLLNPEELPEEWGLLEVLARSVRVAKVCPRTRLRKLVRHPIAMPIEERRLWEATLLVSALRRHNSGAEWDNAQARFKPGGPA